MAKSIRSKSKRKARAIRREKIHAPVEQKRLERLVNSFPEIKEEPKQMEMETDKELTKEERNQLFLNRNQFKKKIRAKLQKKRK
jgi:hypothetical protein